MVTGEPSGRVPLAMVSTAEAFEISVTQDWQGRRRPSMVLVNIKVAPLRSTVPVPLTMYWS